MEEYDSQNAQRWCPICGADNQCAMATGQPPVSCWCKNTALNRAALAAVPENAQGKVCLCPACGREEGDTVER